MVLEILQKSQKLTSVMSNDYYKGIKHMGLVARQP
jgi:hypothetical protein